MYIYIYSLSCLYGWPRNVHNEFDRNAIKFCLGTDILYVNIYIYIYILGIDGGNAGQNK